MRRKIIALHTGFTVQSGTTKTQLGGAAVQLPSWCRSILAVIPTLTPDGLTTAEPAIAMAAVESNDLPIMPFECMPAPMAGVLAPTGASVSSFVGKPEKYIMNVPTPSGGEQVSIYQTPGFDHTSEPYGGATLIVSNMMPPKAQWDGEGNLVGGVPQRHAKVGTVTSTGTTASADVAGTLYSFSGGRRIVELFGVAVYGVIAAADGMAGYIKYTSNEFDGVADTRLPLNPGSAGFGNAISGFVDGVSRVEQEIPLTTTGQVNVRDYAYFGIIPAGAGRFHSGVIYE